MGFDRVGFSAWSDTGRVRALNEDAFLATDPAFFVADGMGGHAYGDLASKRAVAALAERLHPGTRPVPDAVIAAIAAANDSVRGLSTPDATGVALAGTTLSGVVRVDVDGDPYWMVVNVGDSRTYLWDGDRLTQLSVDHSAVQELIDAGELTPDAAATHPERNVVTRALGAGDHVEADVWLLPEASGSCFLVCSDGLTRELDDSGITAVLAAASTAESVARSLVEAAVAAGGHDNVTAVFLERLAQGVDEDTSDRMRLRGSLQETRPRG